MTVDREFIERHAERVEFWTLGGSAFPELDAYRLGNTFLGRHLVMDGPRG